MATYTAEQKAEAVAHYLQHGLADTHHKTGIPKPTLRLWMEKAGHDPAELAARTADKTRAATEARTVAWADRRAGLTDKYGDVAELALDKARELINLGKMGDAQRAILTSACSTDKAQLLSGAATTRHETINPDRNPEYEEVLNRTIRLVQDQAS